MLMCNTNQVLINTNILENISLQSNDAYSSYRVNKRTKVLTSTADICQTTGPIMLKCNTSRDLINTNLPPKFHQNRLRFTQVIVLTSFWIQRTAYSEQRTAYRVRRLKFKPVSNRWNLVLWPLKRVEKWFWEKNFFWAIAIPSLYHKW